MLINAYLRANEEQRKELEDWVAKTNYNESDKIEAVTDLYNRLGIRELCIGRINRYFEEAKELLAEVSLPETAKEALWDFSANLINRKH